MVRLSYNTYPGFRRRVLLLGLDRTAVWANAELSQGPKSAPAHMYAVKACWNRIMKAPVFVIMEALSVTLDVSQLWLIARKRRLYFFLLDFCLVCL